MNAVIDKQEEMQRDLTAIKGACSFIIDCLVNKENKKDEINISVMYLKYMAEKIGRMGKEVLDEL
jgi:hypothetical protein